jgi:serine kinase of HPr protein (carbohydrate metabolism regulator)
MNLQTIIDKLELTVLTEPRDFASVIPKGGYTSDLLSCVMAGAKSNNIWVTLQAHMNIIAVASMLDVAAVIITENAQPEPNVITKANEQNIILLSTSKFSYEICGKLWELNLR